MPIMESKRKVEEGALVPVKRPRNELVIADSDRKGLVESVSCRQGRGAEFGRQYHDLYLGMIGLLINIYTLNDKRRSVCVSVRLYVHRALMFYADILNIDRWSGT